MHIISISIPLAKPNYVVCLSTLYIFKGIIGIGFCGHGAPLVVYRVAALVWWLLLQESYSSQNCAIHNLCPLMFL